jgi:hypothetical protein
MSNDSIIEDENEYSPSSSAEMTTLLLNQVQPRYRRGPIQAGKKISLIANSIRRTKLQTRI